MAKWLARWTLDRKHPGSSPDRGQLCCVLGQDVFKRLAHSASLYPGVGECQQMGASKLSGKPDEILGKGRGVTCDGLASHPG